MTRKSDEKMKAPEGCKLVPLTGNNRTRRAQFKQLCKQYGEDKVTRVDNPKAQIKKTIAAVPA